MVDTRATSAAKGSARSGSPDKQQSSSEVDNNSRAKDVDAQNPAEAGVDKQGKKLRALRKKPTKPDVCEKIWSQHGPHAAGCLDKCHGFHQQTRRQSRNVHDAWNVNLLNHALQPFLPCRNYIRLYTGHEQLRVINILNYYVSFVGPTFVWQNHAITSGTVEQFSRSFLQTSLHEPAFLEILLAICQADFDFRCHGRYNASRAVLGHRARSLKLLHHKLAGTPSPHDEAVLATVCAMLTFDMTLKDWSSFKIHLRYLRRVMSSVGDPTLLGLQGWLAFDYKWAELIWATQSAGVSLSDVPDNETMHDTGNGKHQVSIEVLEFSKRLPPGFRDLAQANVLSPRLIVLLIEITDWIKECSEVTDSVWQMTVMNIAGMKLAAKAARVISSHPADHASALICMALISFLTSYFEDGAGHSRGLEYLTPYIDLEGSGRLGTECCIWVALTIAAANETVPFDLLNRWTLIDDVLKSRQMPFGWEEISKVTRKFFWNKKHAARWKDCWEVAVQR